MLAGAIVSPTARIAAVYFGFFFYYGINLPYWALWLSDRRFDAAAIALLLSAALFAKTVAQPVMAYVADNVGRRRLLILASSITTCATLSFALLDSPLAIMTATIVGSLFIGPVVPIADALTLATGGVNYGRARLWGSIGFILANLAGGSLIDRLGIDSVIWAQLLGLGFMLAMLCLLPADTPARQAIGSNADVSGHGRGALLAQLARQPLLWLFVFVLTLINAGHAYYYAFASKHWSENLGHSGTVIGLLWAWGVLAEIALLAWAGGKAGPQWARGLLLAACAGTVVRWTATAFDPPLPLLFALQTLHALTYAAMHMGAMIVLRQAIPSQVSTTVMGVYAAIVNGLGIGVVTALLGPAYDKWGGLGYLAGSLCGAVATFGLLIFVRHWHGQPFAAIAPETSDDGARR